MKIIKKILTATVICLLFLFLPKEVSAEERYQQQNYWYKADENQSIDLALDKPKKAYAARVNNGNAYMGRLADASEVISAKSRNVDYLIGTDGDGKEWYFCIEDEAAKWVHPVDYNVDIIEYPDTLFYQENYFTVVHIGGAGKSYRKGTYKNSSADYRLKVSADNCSQSYMEDESSLLLKGDDFFYDFDRVEVDIYAGSFGNGYIGSSAIAYKSGSSFVDSETVEVNTRYVNNILQMVIIPETVTEIAPYTFYLCNSLNSIYGCKGVEKYGEYCFAKEYTAEISSFGTETYIHRYEGEYAMSGNNAGALIIAAKEFEPNYIKTISFPDCDFVIGEYAFMGACLYGEIELLNCTSLAEGALKDNSDITVLRLKKMKEVDEKSIEGCYALRIEYVKDEAVYEVRHYLQDTSGNGYILYKSEQFVGMADSVCVPDVYDLEGFLTPQKRRIKINASGTSCIDYYYDRKSVVLEIFGNEGILSVVGTGIYPYGTKVNVVGTVKEGWRFAGWNFKQGGRTTYFKSTENTPEIWVEILDRDIVVELVAEPIETMLYRVRYYFRNETGEYVLGYSEERYGTTDTEAEFKKEFDGFVLTEIPKAVIKGNGSTIVEVYFEKADDNKKEESVKHEQTETVVAVKELYDCKNGHLWYRGSSTECPFCISYAEYEEYEIVEYEAEFMERLYKDGWNS